MANQTEKQTADPKQPKVEQSRRPNETGSISVEAYMRIFDPATKKVYVEGRA